MSELRQNQPALHRCIVCGSGALDPLLTVDQAPLYPFRPAGAGGTGNWFGRIEIVSCRHCGHLCNRAFDDGDANDLYGANVLTNTPVSPSMVKAVEGTAELIMRHARPSPRVLEVGGGAGALTVALSRDAAEVHLVEPSRALAADRFKGSNITFHQTMFPVAALADQEFDVIVCRQVLEHVPDPRPFLAALRKHLDGSGLAYIEIPDASYIRANRSVIDFHYPHVHYFRPALAEVLLRRAGFDVFETHPIKGGHDVAFLVRPMHPADVGPPAADGQSDWAAALAERIARGRQTLDSTAGPIALYGANAYSQAFLALYPDVAVSAMFDDTPFYRGQCAYGPGAELAIDAPDAERLQAASAVVITAYLHDRVIAEKIRSLGYRGPVYTVRADPTAGTDGIPPSLFGSP
jgi:2-polyprenyl-3-methyl-5-hydroxy-6-metoxy-1,4-benzoquinol methylase